MTFYIPPAELHGLYYWFLERRVWLCVTHAGLRHWGSGQIRYHFKQSCVSSSAHRTTAAAAAWNNEQVPGARRQTWHCVVRTHGTMSLPCIASCRLYQTLYQSAAPQPPANTANDRLLLAILMIISTTNGSHSPKILVHGFEEEFVAVDGSIVEDIFKIR